MFSTTQVRQKLASRLANTEAKNRVEYSQLSTRLNRIEKEKQAEMRMLNTEKTRFKAKYMKMNNFPPVSNQNSEIKMYETHNPGFCFKRNGEQRSAQPINTAPAMNFDHLHFLVFTNGEVDIEKVLCLHLLSSHETKHLTPPKLVHTSHSFLKKDSPVEQLIERSKEYETDSASSSSLLPTYILDINKQPVLLKNDQRLMSRMIVNEKLLELITTVMSALEQSNPEKVQDMLNIAADPGTLKRILSKPRIQEFVMLLKENKLVNSCSSFILTQPGKDEANHIEIRTPTGALEDLVRFIRANVLQFPNRDSSSRSLEESRNSSVVVVEDGSPKMRPIDARRITSPRMKTETINRESSREVEEVEEEINPFRRVQKDFITKNIEAIANYRRDKDEAPPSKRKRSSIESRRDSVMESRRTSIDSRRTSTDNRRTSVSSEASRQRKTSMTSEHVRVHSKHTTCPACMERWKIPLPAPKVSKMMRSPVESLNPSNSLVEAANLQQRISMLIDQEQFKLDAYERKYSNPSVSGQGQGRRQSNVSSDSADDMDLNVFDLAKIRQEIREKETKKKLERFLETD